MVKNASGGTSVVARKKVPVPKSRRVWPSSLIYNLRRAMTRRTATGFVERVIVKYLLEEKELDAGHARVLSVGLTTYVNTVMNRLRNNTPMRTDRYTVGGGAATVHRRVISANTDDVVRALLPGLKGGTREFTAAVLKHFKTFVEEEKAERKKRAAAQKQ